MKESTKQAIAEMVERDQKVRNSPLGGSAKKTRNIDKENTEKLKKIVDETGVITLSMGKRVHIEAWLLVQHADHDVEWQEWYLEQLKSLPEEEVVPIHIAFLEDRVRMNKGLPQIYGTQFMEQNDGSFAPYKIKDPEEVDERRESMGLEAIEDYSQRVNEQN